MITMLMITFIVPSKISTTFPSTTDSQSPTVKSTIADGDVIE